jgi:hypothetical protein
LATNPSSGIVVLPGDPRDRIVLKRFLAYLESIRQQRWISLDFPAARISFREAVQSIAMEDTGRTTAIELGRLEGLGAAPPEVQRFLDAVRSIGADWSLHVREHQIDVAVSVDLVRSAVDLKLAATSIRAWCVRHVATVPVGSSTHVITVAGAGLRLHVEKLRCPGDLGGLRILYADPPQYFETVVHEHLERRLAKLVSASADRRVLVFENSDGSWCAGQLRAELKGSVEFAELNRVDEIWIADTAQRSAESARFQRVIDNSAE